MRPIAPPDDIAPRPRSLHGTTHLPGRRLTAALSGLAALLLSTAASASDHSGMGGLGSAIVEAMNELTLYSQGQVGMTGAIGDWAHPGGVSLRSAISFFGLGAAAALRVERVSDRPGGVLALGGQLRPLGAFGTKLYRHIDPFVSVGGELGGDNASVRASGYLGVGCDVALFPSRGFHPAFVIEYQIRPFRTPSDLPLQLLHLGGAMRTVF